MGFHTLKSRVARTIRTPPFDYLARVYFPLLRKLGANVEAGNCHPGFYPAGGGCFGAKVVGCPSLNRLELLDRGVLLHRRVRALVANLPIDIAEPRVSFDRTQDELGRKKLLTRGDRRFRRRGKCCHD